MAKKHVFVTVGTTKFDKLIETVSSDSILKVLKELGFSSVQFQVGTGDLPEKISNDIEIKFDRYFEDFAEQVTKADLVISHAGAGSCLEVLKQKKPLIVVINEDLMDNHQIELAEKLEKCGYVYSCTPNTLKSCLEEKNLGELEKYPEPETAKFASYLDRAMAFT